MILALRAAPWLLGLVAFSSSGEESAPVPPPVPRGLRVEDEGAYPGYTLFGPLQSGSTYLVDRKGEVVHEWKSEYGPGVSVYLLENGHLLRCTRDDENPRFWGGGIGGRIVELDWDGNRVWTYRFSDETRCQHHDVAAMPNGNVLLIAWEYLPPEEAIRRGRDPDVVADEGFWPDAVYEIEPVRPDGGKIVWEWHVRDHLIQDRDPAKPDYGTIADHPGRIDVNGDHVREAPPPSDEERRKLEELEEEMAALGYAGGKAEPATEPEEKRERRGDWLHTNSIDYQPEHDLVLLSVLRFDEVWVIDHSTTRAEAASSQGGRHGKGGDLLWRWGNPRRYGIGTDADRRLYAQHHAQWIDPGLPGAGHVLVFNNGAGPDREFSTVDELVPPFDPQLGFVRDAGKSYGPLAPVWSYVAPEPKTFYSFFISGCQRLPNGNTLVCSGKQGRLFEVTADGRIVWEYGNPYGGEIPSSFGKAAPKQDDRPSPVEPVSVFRATRIPLDHPALRGRTLAARSS